METTTHIETGLLVDDENAGKNPDQLQDEIRALKKQLESVANDTIDNALACLSKNQLKPLTPILTIAATQPSKKAFSFVCKSKAPGI